MSKGKRTIWQYDFPYWLLRYWVDACTRTSFSRLKTEGLENLPQGAALIYAPNHSCTLVDSLVVLQAKHSSTAFGARADIFRKPLAAALLRWLRIVPLARHRDGPEMQSRNISVFKEIVDTLGHGVPFTIFCEGTHFPGREVHPLRRGILTISRMAVDNLEKPVYIVPIGINYDSVYDFQKKCTVRFGTPIEARALLDRQDDDALEMLRGSIQALVSREEPSHFTGCKAGRAILAILSLPIWAACAVLACPILIPEWILCSRLKDKAWVNTVRYACRLLLPLHWLFHSIWHYLLNFYNNLLKDLSDEK